MSGGVCMVLSSCSVVLVFWKLWKSHPPSSFLQRTILDLCLINLGLLRSLISLDASLKQLFVLRWHNPFFWVSGLRRSAQWLNFIGVQVWQADVNVRNKQLLSVNALFSWGCRSYKLSVTCCKLDIKCFYVQWRLEFQQGQILCAHINLQC